MSYWRITIFRIQFIDFHTNKDIAVYYLKVICYYSLLTDKVEFLPNNRDKVEFLPNNRDKVHNIIIHLVEERYVWTD